MDPNLWFEISRKTLIIASVIAAIGSVVAATGGYGVLYFGRQISSTQNLKIADNNKKAAEANERASTADRIAAEANEKAKIAEGKTQELEVKSKKLNVQLNTAISSAEKEKQKRINLEIKALELEREATNIRTATDRIRSLKIITIIDIEDDGAFTGFTNGFNHVRESGYLKLLNKDLVTLHTFIPDSEIKILKNGENKIRIINHYSHENTFQLNTIQISTLNMVSHIDLKILSQIKSVLKGSVIKPIKPIITTQIVILNDVETLNFGNPETEIGTILNNEISRYPVANIFENISEQYDNKIGRTK